MKKQFVESLTAGSRVEEIFVLAEKRLAQKKDGANYLTLRLSDRTGSLSAVAWDNVEKLASSSAAGDFVRIAGNVGEYRGELQIIVKEMTAVDPASVTAADFLPATAQDVDQMFDRLVRMAQTMETPPLRDLLAAFFADADFVERFKKAPAAKMMHHAYIGGLLEHCLSMALLADRIARHYGGVNRDRLLAGVVLHDIGKVREFDYQHRIDYSDEGRLVGHIAIGLEMLDEKVRMVDRFPDEERRLLKHMIVSHHGAMEYGSPEPPKTVEAVLLHYIDEIDSKINGIREFIAAQAAEDAWTPYHRVLGRHFYRGSDGE
jgi:3'-5' exoribonuclease